MALEEFPQEAPIPPSNGSPPAAFEVIALVASAGGLGAFSAVLRDLPAGFPATILVIQHLGDQGSILAEILDRRTALQVEWIIDGASILPGGVHVCPARKRMTVLPDGTCSLSPGDRGALDRPMDFCLESLADNFGQRALAVVLTGMGRDASIGALAMKHAGGTVLVQSRASSEQPSMPRAAIENGAADLVLPLHEIGPLIVNLAAGGRLPGATPASR